MYIGAQDVSWDVIFRGSWMRKQTMWNRLLHWSVVLQVDKQCSGLMQTIKELQDRVAMLEKKADILQRQLDCIPWKIDVPR
jgi:uncharacterized protein YhaN